MTQVQTKMALGNLVRGKLNVPLRVVLYGPEGCGKTTFGSKAPGAIFLPTEDGTAQLDVVRFPRPGEWNDVLFAIDNLVNEKHDFKTLVVDTLDGMEPLVWAHVVAEANESKIQNIEDFGYGKGYTYALAEWQRFLAALDRLWNAKGMNIILLAHSQVKRFQSPEVSIDGFDRYELKLNGKASGVVKEWPEAVLFANYETLTAEKDGKVKGVSTGQRIIHTERTAAFDAKNRYSLPSKLPLSWEAFEGAVNAGKNANIASLKDEITALIKKAKAQVAKEAEGALSRAADDLDKLRRLKVWLNTQVNA